jgi:hypothetical protein
MDAQSARGGQGRQGLGRAERKANSGAGWPHRRGLECRAHSYEQRIVSCDSSSTKVCDRATVNVQRAIPERGCSRVDLTLVDTTCRVAMLQATTSVNVPPISMPTCQPAMKTSSPFTRSRPTQHCRQATVDRYFQECKLVEPSSRRLLSARPQLFGSVFRRDDIQRRKNMRLDEVCCGLGIAGFNCIDDRLMFVGGVAEIRIVRIIYC